MFMTEPTHIEPVIRIGMVTRGRKPHFARLTISSAILVRPLWPHYSSSRSKVTAG